MTAYFVLIVDFIMQINYNINEVNKGGTTMKVRIKSANSVRCPKCGKLMSAHWFGYRCSQCTYEQLNTEGRKFMEKSKWVESDE